jgi:hypothetical protein
MGFLEGLSSINEVLERKGGGDYEDRPKLTWLSVDPDTSVKIIPLQEIDKGSPNYSAKNGLAKVFLEHSDPDNFKKKAECTIDEGSCYGCAQGWWQKPVLYVNVLVDDGKKDPYVAVFSRSANKKSIGGQLFGIAADEDYNLSISDKVFKLSRTGKGSDSSYSLNILKQHDKNVEDYEVFDLSRAAFHVNPENQEKYFTGSEGGKKKEEEPVVVDAASVDADW